MLTARPELAEGRRGPPPQLSNDVLDPSFNGTLGLTVNDASQPKMIPDFYPGVNYEYLAPGGVIFRGAQSVTNGRFRGSFIVPKDIQYADSTSAGRLSGYFWNGSMDGGAYTGNVRITGSDSTALSDRDGPAIAIYLKSRAHREGDMVDENPLLIVEFVDSSGINTSGSGIGHSIEAWLDNALESTDLTALYTSGLDDYRRGSLERRLTGLINGRHTIRIRAWDSFNNSSTSQTQFQVASASPLTIADLFTYPNPFTDQTKERVDPHPCGAHSGPSDLGAGQGTQRAAASHQRGERRRNRFQAAAYRARGVRSVRCPHVLGDG